MSLIWATRMGIYRMLPRSAQKRWALSLLGQGRKLADGLKQELCAVVIAKDEDEAVKEAESTARIRHMW